MAEVFFSDNNTLWETDGTPGGTHQVSAATVVDPHFINVDGRLFFTAGNIQTSTLFPGPNAEVWTSDGTSAGTQELASGLYQPGVPATGILDHADLNGTLFFSADDKGTHGFELWQSDGTVAGTHLLKDINTHYADSSFPTGLAKFNGALFFSANDGIHGTELWRTDGTSAGTQMLADLVPGPGSGGAGDFTIFNGALFFEGPGNGGGGLWKTDGTAAGTQQVFAGGLGTISQPIVSNGKMVFTDGNLWASDGTSAGTQIIAPGASFPGARPASLTLAGSEIFFIAADGTHGSQLWDTDGTAGGTQELTLVNVATTTPGLHPGQLTAVGSKLFFTGTDGANGTQLWVSDGTAAGTQELTSVVGSTGLQPGYLTNVAGTLFFVGLGGPDGNQLWTSDGTAAGTHAVTSFPANANNGHGIPLTTLNNLTAVGDKLYFFANDGTGEHAFVTDGTTTTILADGSPFAASDAFFAMPNSPPTIVVPPGSAVGSFDTTQDLTLDLTQADQPHNFSLSGNDTIVAGAAAASITATAGNDLVSISSSATGGMSFTGQAGNDTMNAASGTNQLVGGSGSDQFHLSGGNNTAFTGSGTATIDITGGAATVVASQGTSTITDGSAPLLLGLLGGSHQVNLNDGAPIVLATGGTSTISASAMPAAPEIGVFGGSHLINAGTGGDTVFGVGGNSTINGGSGLNGIDMVSGSTQVNAGAGITEIFVNGGSNNVALLQSDGGPVLISGYDPTLLHFVIASHINGQVFTDPSQIPTSHTADGNLLLDLGTGSHGPEQVLLVGVSSIDLNAAITLV